MVMSSKNLCKHIVQDKITMTTEELIKVLQKYPKDTQISIWQDEYDERNNQLTVTYCSNTKEIILY